MGGFLPYILVVDDYRDAADSTAEIVTLWGYDSKAHYTAETALAAVRIRRPALVLLEVAPWPTTGFAFAEAFRNIPGCARTAVVALTGNTSEAARVRGRNLGIAHCLFKPADPDVLRDLVVCLLADCMPGSRNRARPTRPVPAARRSRSDADPHAGAAGGRVPRQYAETAAAGTARSECVSPSNPGNRRL